MLSRRYFLLLFLLGAAACEPIGVKEDALDSEAIFDQKPLRSEGWTTEGSISTNFDGLTLSSLPTSKSDGVSEQELSLNNVSLFRKFQALSASADGTLRLKFSFPKLPQSGFRFELSFATGMGLPSEVRITEAGVTAKCGHLSLQDGVESRSADKKMEANKEYELRLTRSADFMNVLLDNEVVVNDLPCTALQDSNEEPRSAGYLKLNLFSQLPKEPITWTQNDKILYENTISIKRVTLYPDIRLK